MSRSTTATGIRRSLAVLCGTLLAAASCADNNTSIYVEAVLAPQPPNCVFAADPSAAQLMRGVLDVAFVRSYQGTVLVANQLTPRGIKNQLRAETAGFLIEGVEVLLTDAEGNTLEQFTAPNGGFVHPSASQAPGYGIAFVTMIPPSRGQRLLRDLENRPRGTIRTLVASVRVFGRTAGGVEITSGDFVFPIDVCHGCLVTFPPEAIEDTGNGRVCGGTSERASAAQCVMGQDALVDCRQCASTLGVCATPD